MGREARANAKKRPRYELARRVVVPPCSVCGLPAFYACADCLIDRDEKIAICDRSSCRDEHERSFPSSHPVSGRGELA